MTSKHHSRTNSSILDPCDSIGCETALNENDISAPVMWETVLEHSSLTLIAEGSVSCTRKT